MACLASVVLTTGLLRILLIGGDMIFLLFRYFPRHLCDPGLFLEFPIIPVHP